MHQLNLTISENKEIAANVYRMVLRGEVKGVCRPGQFINIKLPGYFLRRPISICDYSDNDITILYKAVGNGTELMTGLKEGTVLDVLCGLGNGFDLSKAAGRDRVLLIGGGIGSAPMLALARELKAKGIKTHAVLGFNTGSEVILADELKAAGADVTIMTADGSGCGGIMNHRPQEAERGERREIAAGDADLIRNDGGSIVINNSTDSNCAGSCMEDCHVELPGISFGRGFVTDAGILQEDKLSDKSYYYACGPSPMLKAVYRSVKCDGELSFEERMGCGFGACMGCSMHTVNGAKRVCKDGPVFARSELLWD